MNLNIEGDLNINILLTDGMLDAGADIGADMEDEKDEAEMIVMMLCPGSAPKVLTYGEACEKIPEFADSFVPVDFGKSGLTLYFPENKIIKLGKEVYLFGNAVICSETRTEICGRCQAGIFMKSSSMPRKMPLPFARMGVIFRQSGSEQRKRAGAGWIIWNMGCLTAMRR
ncbi:MAG: hypothetical protein LUI07_05665 [Lachnospiraceae bacterium]|nr:hypothetical protein [Lachnospiraceae bacterium]